MERSDDEREVVAQNHVRRGIKRASAPGMKFVDEVLNGPNESCLENFRMDKQVFYKLCDTLQSKRLLRHTNRIKIEEQLAIFLFIIGHNLRTRAVQELFRYSGETISRHFNNVLNSIMAISLDCFEPQSYDVPPEITSDPRFYPFFKDCVGFVDCIHIPVTIGVDEQGPFRNKDGLLAQIVLAACSFDLKFNYILAGWEGSALEMRVLHSAITRHNNLKVPEGKYYIVDDKFNETVPGFIAPYQGVTNHSNESYHPQDAKELFNQRHSLLKSASDRIFGALKERFPILTSAPPYPLQTQVKLVVAACALHNFIRREKPDDLIFQSYEQDYVLLHNNNKQGEDLAPSGLEEYPMMNNTDAEALEMVFEPEHLDQSSELRDSIAVDMWDDYIRGFASM